MSTRPKIVVLGMLARIPVAGAIWQNVHYLLGLRRLGLDVYYVEAHARTPTMLMESAEDDGGLLAAGFLDGVMRRFDLGDRWSYHALHDDDGRCYGLSEDKVRSLYRDAELIVNLHGSTVPLPEHVETGRLVYLETDPVELEIELHDEIAEAVDFARAHNAFSTWALNYGGDDCLVPLPSWIDFEPAPPPVLLDLWTPTGTPPRPVFTTVGNWRQWGEVRYLDETYTWSKHHEFLKFVDLPSHTSAGFELALGSFDDDDRRLLEDNRWQVRRARDVTHELDHYRDYVRSSLAEFTVAKDQNVRLRSGWFSERSAVYLASGRPVITQDTGFGSYLPTGEGLFAFSTLDDAVAAVEDIVGDYPRHSRAAREIAREYFDANVVLPRVLETFGIEAPQQARRRHRVTTVGVVIPCFDLGEHLLEAVDSVRTQSRPADAFVVVDDGSTDEHTLAVLEELRRDGVTVLRTENRGAPAARNHGIEQLETDYVLCLDADDVLLPEFLAKTVPVLDSRPDVAIVTTHVELFGEQDGIWETSGYDPVRLLFENCLASASLFRRGCWSEVGGYADLAAGQDWDFWISIVERGWEWEAVPELLYRYRVRPDSISSRADRRRIVRDLLVRHQDTYRKNWRDVLVQMDAETQGLRELVRRQEADLRERDAELLMLREQRREAAAPRDETPHDGLVRRMRESIEAVIPEGCGVLVVTKGDDTLLRLGRRDGRHFPAGDDGGWAGYHPKNSADAIAALEAARTAGGDFLVVPQSSLWWLDHYEDFRRHVEQRYRAVFRRPDTGVVFDTRSELEPRTFSVVICTYNRASLVRGAIESVLAQEYPKDRYELIVVDNGSTDDTASVVAEYATASDVRVSYLVEPRNGLSYARNFGIARARFEYVAFLDDDARARPDWLAAFNTVIEEHHALVVGGRIEPVIASGSAAPAWFADRYVRGFFGLDYADRKDARVFPIRYPLYIGGGNSAYAKRLFPHFGSFRGDLGRNGRSLLAAEETYLNLELERRDVPVYYSADAVVEHVIEPSRLTKRHIRRKAYWAGVSDSIARSLLDGPAAARRQVQCGLHELLRRAVEVARRRGEDRIVASCRLAYLIGFRLELTSLLLARALRLRRHVPEPCTWTIEHAIEEVSHWPDGDDKRRHLHDLLVAAGRDDEAQAILSAAGERPAPVAATAQRPLLRSQYGGLIERVRDDVQQATPHGARVLVVSKGDDEFLDLDGRRGLHFPQGPRGVYAGHYPADSDAAVEHLESLRSKGAEYLLFPATSFWWFEHYRGFARHLESRYRCVCRDETCLIFDVREPAAERELEASDDRELVGTR